MESTETATTQVPSHAIFKVVLDNYVQGTPVIEDANCEFSYIWDFEKNMGLAHLNSINGDDMNIVLHPLGIADRLAFMSDMSPTSYVINGQRVIIYRVILDLRLPSGEKTAAIMFNEDGSCIETTGNWDVEDTYRFH